MPLRILLQVSITLVALFAIYIIGVRGIADYYAQRSYEVLLGQNHCPVYLFHTWS